MKHVSRLATPFLLALAFALLLASAVPTEAARGPRKAPGPDAVVAGELLVRFESGVSAKGRELALDRAGARSERAIRHLGARVVKVDPADARTALKTLQADPRVAYAEPNSVVSATLLPNDELFNQLWGLRNTGQTIVSGGVSYTGTPDADIDADEAWDVTTGSRDVVVAVIDTGVDFSHPDLGGSRTAANALMWTNSGEMGAGKETNGRDDDGNGYVDDWRGWDFVNDDNDPFDDESHGTHVTGTIAAKSNNTIGVAGVAPNVRIMALKFLAFDGYGDTADAAEAVAYAAAMGAHVTNNSWGGGAESETLREAIEQADARRSLFVAAAGNETYDNDSYPSYPASYEVPNVISVGGSSQRDELAWFTNHGRRTVDLAAPGENIYSTLPGGGYEHWDGTSMSTPHVVGAAALAKSVVPGATAAGLKALLLRTVDPIPALEAFMATGGRLNAAKAVRCAGKPQVWAERPSAGFKVAVGEAVAVEIVAGVCGAPGAAVTASANGASFSLVPRGDGVYTGTFVPVAAGSVALTVTGSAGAQTDTLTVNGRADDNWRFRDAPFAWIDATAGGTMLTELGDDDLRSVPLPFSFTFDGASFTRVHVSSNGFLDFGANDMTESHLNVGVPNTEQPNGIAAAYWDDLDPGSAGGVWYRTVGTAPNRKFVVAWVGVPRWSGTGNGGSLTFEAILEEGTNEIVFQYRDVSDANADVDHGASATVGVESRDGWIGREFLWNQPKLKGYENAKALRFSRGATPPADTTPPETTIDSGPAGTTTLTAATFAFSATEAGAVFDCRLDTGAWATCTSPMTYSGLATGAHTFQVRSRDAAGNLDTTPAERTWTVQPFDGGLIRNGAFDGSTDGWLGWRAGIGLVPGRNGDALRVNGTGESSFSAYTSPRPVAHGMRGDSYRATAWVRSETGKVLCLFLREWTAAGAVAGSASSCVVSSAAWQMLDSVVYTLTDQGGTLEAFVIAYGAEPGDSFDVDEASLYSTTNLIGNGDFVNSVSGWGAWRGALSLAPGRSDQAARVSGDGSASFSIYTVPRPVPHASVGRPYRAVGWVRSATGGRPVCLFIREWSAMNSVTGSAHSCVTATSTWQAFAPVDYVATADGGSIEVFVIAYGAVSGDSFDVDDIALTAS